MKNVMKVIGVLILSAGMMTSCKKYEDGGPIRKAEKNITKSWKIESYYLDGVDNTSNLLISNYVETFSDNTVFTRNYTDESGDVKSESGSWVLDNDKSLINVSGIGSYELTNETSTVSASDYSILKLTKNELWYEFENGGSTHEFHLVPN